MRANKRLPTCDDGGCWWTTAATAVGRRCGGDIVVQVGVQRRKRKEIAITASAEWGDVGAAQSLTDVDVLPRYSVLGDGALYQLVKLVGAEGHGVAQPAILRIAPAKFDPTFVAAVQPSFEQVAEMAAHLYGLRLELGADVGHSALA